VRWQTNLVAGFGPVKLYWDQGTSPVLTESAVVIARMHHGESWLAAFDKASGKLCWKVPRNYETPVEGDESYASPIVLRHQGKEAVLVWGAEHVTFHDAADGQLVWSCGDFNPRAMEHWPSVASPVLAGNIVVVAGGRADRGQPLLFGIRLGGKGDVTATHRVWKREDVGTYVPTPAEDKGASTCCEMRVKRNVSTQPRARPCGMELSPKPVPNTMRHRWWLREALRRPGRWRCICRPGGRRIQSVG